MKEISSENSNLNQTIKEFNSTISLTEIENNFKTKIQNNKIEFQNKIEIFSNVLIFE